MKILHVAKFYPPVVGGMETLVHALCQGTAENWDVRAVVASASARGGEERCEHVWVERAGSLGVVASVPICPALPLRIWKERVDCVVLHEPNPVGGSALFLHTPAPRLIVWHHSDLLRPWWAPATYGRIQRALYRRADCVVVTSPVARVQSGLVQHARRVAVIPLGIDLDRFGTLDRSQRLRMEAIRQRSASPRFLFVGRFVYYKGLEVLVAAMTRCRGTLLLVGDGPLEDRLRRQVASAGLVDRVLFVGRVPDEDLPAYYHAADVFVLPSIARTEAYGLVQTEAMAAGVPVVSTNLPTGVPWVNGDGITGLVVPPNDAPALAAALNRLGDDTELRQTLGAQGRLRAAALFGRKRTIEVFKSLVETTVRTPDRLDGFLPDAELV